MCVCVCVCVHLCVLTYSGIAYCFFIFHIRLQLLQNRFQLGRVLIDLFSVHRSTIFADFAVVVVVVAVVVVDDVALTSRRPLCRRIASSEVSHSVLSVRRSECAKLHTPFTLVWLVSVFVAVVCYVKGRGHGGEVTPGLARRYVS